MEQCTVHRGKVSIRGPVVYRPHALHTRQLHLPCGGRVGSGLGERGGARAHAHLKLAMVMG
jgi:hypothetical protein